MTHVAFKDYSKYLRVPYLDKGRDTRGWDCYGLYRFLLAEFHGILLPSYTDQYGSAESGEVCELIARVRPVGWAMVPTGEARQADAVVLRIGGMPWHCGYVIEPGIMLHARKGCGTAMESYTSRLWNKRLEGIYRCKL